jgi:hypothetical protein
VPAATARQWHVPDLSQFSDQESLCGVGCFTHTPTSPSEPRVPQATPQTHNIQQRHFPYDKRDGVRGGQARVRKRAAVPPRAGRWMCANTGTLCPIVAGYVSGQTVRRSCMGLFDRDQRPHYRGCRHTFRLPLPFASFEVPLPCASQHSHNCPLRPAIDHRS